ncbi:MAG: DUF4982 domain-containing protein [Paludibacteraceae bacterium]|nr:DUF4982 domain-containing protein [Paludibacteraceae bacterium]
MRKILVGICVLSCVLSNAQRTEVLLEKGWKFTREDNAQFSEIDVKDCKWESVVVPHDWAIYGPFSSQNDKQHVAILQDGQKEAMEHAGRTGGLPFVGVGWYRLKFDAPKSTDNKRVVLLFDGAMSEPQVFVNGKKAGEWKYGYNSFEVDITNFISESGKNTLAVRLENMPESSRWYPGAGIYRNVHLITTEKTYFPTWGTQITTPVVNKDFAKIDIKTTIKTTAKPEEIQLETKIFDQNNQLVATTKSTLSKYDNGLLEQSFVIDNPKLWNVETPNLYYVESKLYEQNKLKDTLLSRFGVRSIELRPDKGFFLNGEKVIFQGVCNHHDLGPLGAAVNDAAIRRQIRILKDMGCNAIRTSHNMPAPELVTACDEMGMMLMVESFDEWQIAKVKNGYNRFFNEWAEKDLTNLIEHYRNNPSVVMWCIGNEVPNQGVEGECKTAKMLQDICHRLDPTRPVTQGMDNPHAVINNNFAAVMDVAGFNYRPFMYPENYKKLPQRLVLGSETTSALSSRGVYKFPVVRKRMAKYPDHQASSYDVEHVGWGGLPDDDFIQYGDLPYCMGEFVWTGFDYLGEPTPYYEDWPSHSSLFGIIDLAGLPKDRYYLYRSHWNKTSPTLHVLPHWTFEGREGEVTPIFVYTSYPSAEVFINGKSQGRKTKDLSIRVEDSGTDEALDSLVRQKRYRLMWMDTKYEPGTVKVVAYDENGNVAEEKEIHTAGKPHHIELVADKTTLKADGKDLSFITVRVVDKDGNLCPDDDRQISFKVKGAGTYRAAANGKTTSLELFHLPQMTLFSGQLTAIVQAGEKAGDITFEASAKGVKKAKLVLKSK